MKKFLVIYLFFLLSINHSFSAGTSSDSSANQKTNYEKAVSLINSAKNYEKKGKIDKAEKRYEKAFKLLVRVNKKKPNNPNTLNYLGFTTRKLGNFEMGERYYLQGLDINPNHIGINEYLGELYVVTNRIDLAKERLQVLKGCDCKEYEELEAVINGSKKSKY